MHKVSIWWRETYAYRQCRPESCQYLCNSVISLLDMYNDKQ